MLAGPKCICHELVRGTRIIHYRDPANRHKSPLKSIYAPVLAHPRIFYDTQHNITRSHNTHEHMNHIHRHTHKHKMQMPFSHITTTAECVDGRHDSTTAAHNFLFHARRTETNEILLPSDVCACTVYAILLRRRTRDAAPNN